MDVGWKGKDPQMYHELNLGGNELISGGVWEFAGCVCVSMVLGCLVVLWGLRWWRVVLWGTLAKVLPPRERPPMRRAFAFNLRRRIVRGHCGLD